MSDNNRIGDVPDPNHGSADPNPESCSCHQGPHRHRGGEKGGGRRKRIRRIHGLCGLCIGGFLLMHLGIGMLGLWPGRFDVAARQIQSIADSIRVLEYGLIYLPIVILVGTGLYLIARDWLSMADAPNRGGRWRYFFQHVSGATLMLFVMLHVGTFGRLAPWNQYRLDQPFESTRAGITQLFPAESALHGLNLPVVLLYGAAIVAISYHLANGLTVAAHIWRPISAWVQDRRWIIACISFGSLLLGLGLLAWMAFL